MVSSYLSGGMESWSSFRTYFSHVWSILPELLNRLCWKNTHFPYLLLMLEPWTVKTTVAMGAWLNIVMTQGLCWKGGEVRFQSLFSSSGSVFYPVMIWSKMHKQFWAHGPGAKLFQKQSEFSNHYDTKPVCSPCAFLSVPKPGITQSEDCFLCKMLGDWYIFWPESQVSRFLDKYSNFQTGV